MNELIEMMKYADTWYQHDFSKVLTSYNSTKGDEVFFNDLIYRAQKAGCFDPIKIPRIGEPGFFSDPLDLNKYNFEYKCLDLVSWALSKKFKLPDQFSAIMPGIKFSNVDHDHECYSTELDIANNIYRSIINNRDQKISFKQQTINLLNSRYPDLSNLAQKRITLLINPDKYKSGGAPKKEV